MKASTHVRGMYAVEKVEAITPGEPRILREPHRVLYPGYNSPARKDAATLASAGRLRISLGNMLRLLDARTGSRVEVKPTRAGLLRVCAHAPETASGTDLTGLRVLLTADLLTRAAELRNLQVLAVLAFAGQPAGPLTEFEQDAAALGMHPPVARVSHQDARAALDGPIDVHLVSGPGGPESALDGLSVPVGGAARTGPLGRDGNLPAGSLPQPLAVRLALLSFPYHQPADLADGQLAEAAATLRRWRRLVAEWAELPSRPMAAPTAEAVRAAFDDLDVAHALALLHGLSLDFGVAEGAKFETFLYADRILGLDLPAEIGQPHA